MRGTWFDLRDSQGPVVLRLPTTISLHRRLDPDQFVLLEPGDSQAELVDLTLSVALPPEGAVTGRVMYAGAGAEYGFWTTEPGLPSEELSIVLRSPPERPAYGYLGLVGAKWWHAEMALDLALRMYDRLTGLRRPPGIAELATYYRAVALETKGEKAEAIEGYQATVRALPGTAAALLAEEALGRLRGEARAGRST
ncbi:MAG: hypothetical protein ACE5R4_18125 [Armatimonadota bacterium]